MKIIYGLKSGAVLQRDEKNQCKCFLKAEIYGEVRPSIGNITALGSQMYELSGIPVGGPYTLQLSDDESEICLDNIYVGDVWILAGQSNMEGAGKLRQKQKVYEENPVPSIRAYYMKEGWDVAKPQLHQQWESVDPWISDLYKNNRKSSPWKTEYPSVQRDGVGPGLFFALEMQKINAEVPQGLIPCGIGGSSLMQWDPNAEDNFYTSMRRRFRECGGNVKGVFWHQGESQTHEAGCASFISDMKVLVASMRTDLGNPKLPFVQVQLHKYHGATKEMDIWWTKIREMQRIMDQHINDLATVYSVDCGLDDLIHLSSDSQEIVGKRAARAMEQLITGQGIPSPQFEGFEIVTDEFVPFRINIIAKYKNIEGDLQATGIPFGFSILDREDGDPIREIVNLELEKDRIRIRVELNPDTIEEYYVCYGYGNTYYCNITDGADRSIPAMGPLKIKNYILKRG